MRLMVIKQPTDLQTLIGKLLKAPAGDNSTSMLDRVKALNPHVDFQSIKADTVLLLPDVPGLDTTNSQSAGGAALAAFATALKDGFAATSERLRSGADTLTIDRTAINGALDRVRQVIEGDPQLRQQLDEVRAQLSADQKHARESAKVVETMQAGAAAELATLGTSLR